MWRLSFILMIAAFLLAGRGLTDEELKPSQSTQALVGLSVEQVKEEDMPVIVTAPGKAKANPTLIERVMAKVEGRVAKVMVEVGDIVKTDAPLLVIDSREVGEARAFYRKAKAKALMHIRTIPFKEI